MSADFFHPLAADSADRNYTFSAFICFILTYNVISIVCFINGKHRCVKEEINFIFKMIVYVFKNNLIDVCAEMTDRRIKKMKVILYTFCLEMTSCS